MVRTMTLVLLFVLVAGVAMAQTGPGDFVDLQTGALEQGAAGIGNPPGGNYNVLVNGWIEAYAKVSAYDNWISFGVMSPTSGTYAAPARRWAFSTAGASTYALTGEAGGQNPLYAVNGSTTNFDLAGLQIQTNARLDLNIGMGGYLTRCKDDGTAFAGVDTRKTVAGPYQLRNQVKMVFRGKFLVPDPADDVTGDAYVALTSGDTTAYNTWTDWGVSTNAIDNEDGWFEPRADVVDPWLGGGSFATDGGRSGITNLSLVVERGQAQASGTGEAAEVWWTQRVLRRGLQDVAGNYRSDMTVTLVFREGDAQWTPTAK